VDHKFRLITYNIRKGKGASGRLDGSVADLGHALVAHHPDIISCQEVFHGSTKPIAQSVQLGKLVGLPHYYLPNRTRKVGHHGNATFTRFAVLDMHNHDISTNPVEKRGVLQLKLNLHGAVVHVFNAHLGLNQRQRSVQIRHIAAIIQKTCKPTEAVVLAGDFNDWNRVIDRYVTQKMGLVNVFGHVRGPESRTWHARRLVFNLDRIYVRNIRAVNTQRLAGAPWNELSDHLPLWAELEIL
jgi:endonuclease/exonuclease/phosphatase family metal-dependent hydrolase